MVRKRKEDFTNYMSNVLQNSMLTGIPQIAAAGNLPKKLLRALVFILCVAGFVYQSMLFMQMYWAYETVINVEVTNPKEIELPSITVCNFNGLQISEICKDPKHNKSCQQLEDDDDWKWCPCLPRYCEDGVLKNISTPSWSYLDDMSEFSYEEYEKFLQDFEDFMVYCVYTFAYDDELNKDCNNSYYQRIRAPSAFMNIINVCYTINTLIGKPNGIQPKVLSNGVVLLELDPRAYEYSTKIRTVTTQVSFHHPRTVLNPYTHGFTMYQGFSYIFRLKKVVKKLLPAPYETDCFDYIEMWKARGGRGPTNERECIEECQKNVSLELSGCIESFYLMPGNEKRCGPEVQQPDLIKLYLKCAAKNCKRACYEESFEITKDSEDKDYYPSCGSQKSESVDTMEVKLHFDGMETTTYAYSPKFENIETFSYLGGYVGMWLGISLVAVFDFLETVVVMLKYPFRRYLDFKSKRKIRVENMHKMQRRL